MKSNELKSAFLTAQNNVQQFLVHHDGAEIVIVVFDFIDKYCLYFHFSRLSTSIFY